MTKTFLKSVNVEDFSKPSVNPKINHEALSSYIIANYLFTNLNERINFFKDINELFEHYLSHTINEYYETEYRRIQSTKTKTEVVSILKENIKLVYKGGNMINHYLNMFKNIWNRIGVDIKADTLSDFDFSLLINYDYILENLTMPKIDEQYIKLTRLGDLIAFNMIKHFNNYMFCYDSDILKDSFINSKVTHPSTVYYKFADIDQAKIDEIFNYTKDYFNDIFSKGINLDLYPYKQEIIDKLNNGDLKHDLKLHFDVISICADTSIDFVGFSLPTTFNKHKKIFKELDSINENNSMKLGKFVHHLVNNIRKTNPENLSTVNALANKIFINDKLKYLDERYDRIKTKLIEVYPSNEDGDYCNFLPSKMVELYDNQIKNSEKLLTIYDDWEEPINYNNFYNVSSNKLTLYDDIKYSNFVKTDDFSLEDYTKTYLNEYYNTNENMVSISSNFSLLFGPTNKDGDWINITSFNLERGKIPVRYFFKLKKPYLIEGNLIKYLFIDYLGELIDISISTYGDSYYRRYFISKSEATNNKEFTDKLNQVEITGNTTTNKVNILTYSLEYFISDLYVVIFGAGVGKPWKIQKYEKRIARLFKTYLAYLKDKYNSTDGLEMYNTFICYIEKVIEQFKQTSNIDINLASITEPLDNIFKAFLAKLDKLSKDIEQPDRDQMIQFLDLLICYLKPNSDCINKFKGVENLKPFTFLSESPKSNYLDKFNLQNSANN